jgi:hypothetical protein
MKVQTARERNVTALIGCWAIDFSIMLEASDGGEIRRPPNCLSTSNLMFRWWSQHAHHKLATCSPQVRNIARNMYTMSGEEGGARNMGKRVRNMGKCVRNVRNTLDNIMIRRLICFLIRIVWLGRCHMLAPGSNVDFLS